MQKISFFNLTLSFIALMSFWIIMSGFMDAIHLTLGVLTVVSVMFINYKLKALQFFDDDMDDLSKLRFHRAFLYLFWLVYQIVIAGFHVVIVITRLNMNTRPTILKFKTNLPSAHAKMILGNSITLTPGTLTVDITGDTFTVHALDEQSFEGIVSDDMPRQVYKLFSKEDCQVIRDINITPGSRK